MSRKVPTRYVLRAKELGRIGGFLIRWLPRRLPRNFHLRGLSGQAKEVLGGNGARYDFKGRLAMSMLACDAPLQINASSQDVVAVADCALRPLEKKIPAMLNLGKNVQGIGVYASKANPLGRYKANVRFGDVWRDLVKFEPAMAQRYQELSGYTRQFTDDQAVSTVLYARGLAFCVPDPVAYAIRSVLDKEGCKSLNIVIKGAGLNATHIGCMLCEAVSLQGRGVAPINLEEKAFERVGEPGAAGSIPNLNEGALRMNIRQVLRRELRSKRVEFDDLETFWDRRWLWAVNGGHSRIREKYDPTAATTIKGRAHRRAVLEDWKRNPIPDWDGKVYVSSSEKHEHGKTRYIMACDTVSYVAFEHLLAPVERAWRNDRVLLDPGSLGHSGVAKRVLEQSDEGGDVWVMLDYDDFNSQHTLKAQSMVIEELVAEVGYPEELARKLIDSFSMMYVSVGDKLIGKVTATLMSGHRGTTFLNSVLNAAYIRLGCGSRWDHMKSLHTGDDIVIAVETFDAAGKMLSDVNATGVRMNPMKQSIGCLTAEFLRMAITRKGARGYLARAVASCVSGSWTSSEQLSQANVVRHAAQAARTLINRSGCSMLPLLLITSLRRRSGLSNRISRGVLLGEIAVGNGPSFRPGNLYESVVLSEEAGDHRKKRLSGSLPSNATDAYLAKSTTALEQSALIMTGTSLTETMLEASYGKTLEDGGRRASGMITKYSLKPPVPARGSVCVSEISQIAKCIGVLQRYPLLSYVRRKLSLDQVIELIKMAGEDPGVRPLVTAWGAEAHGTVINGTLSYSDASGLSRKTLSGTVHVDYPVAV